jgi:ABC-type sugar transport system ATPase subunit
MAGLEFRDVRKSFGAVRALTGVSFRVAENEAHALVGENGAGKSTLLKILAGIVRPDGGAVIWRDEHIELARPKDALERGIGMVYQEMLCFPNLSVAANIFAGRELTRGGRLLDAEMRRRTRTLLDELHLSIDPDARAESLSAAHRQLLQVARALAFQCQILVLDEPTTSLTDAEADHLFAVLHRLKRQGTTLLYVSHRIPEVFRLCDRITVLRDGGYVGTYERTAIAPDAIVRAMVGRDLPHRVESAPPSAAEGPAIEVVDLTRRPCFEHVSLSVAPGEIVGLFGLVGSGRSELLETLFGLHAPGGGEIRIRGRAVHFRSARDAARAGIALVPEERQRQGLFFNLNIRHNLVMPRRIVRGDVRVRAADERREAGALVSEWRIKASSVDAPPDSLSGGNQQKIVVAKWLATAPSVLLLDEPTKGVDVGAKFEIHAMIRRQAEAGLACLVVSSDLPEVLSIAQRVIVMREGIVRGVLAGPEATEEAIMQLATHESDRNGAGRSPGALGAAGPAAGDPAGPGEDRVHAP